MITLKLTYEEANTLAGLIDKAVIELLLESSDDDQRMETVKARLLETITEAENRLEHLVGAEL